MQSSPDKRMPTTRRIFRTFFLNKIKHIYKSWNYLSLVPHRHSKLFHGASSFSPSEMSIAFQFSAFGRFLKWLFSLMHIFLASCKILHHSRCLTYITQPLQLVTWHFYFSPWLSCKSPPDSFCWGLDPPIVLLERTLKNPHSSYTWPPSGPLSVSHAVTSKHSTPLEPGVTPVSHLSSWDAQAWSPPCPRSSKRYIWNSLCGLLEASFTWLKVTEMHLSTLSSTEPIQALWHFPLWRILLETPSPLASFPSFFISWNQVIS